ncbi:hypothetical protein SS50377_24282 [Spironucleus salmonicida]|uniref:Uncharacterized protein n=1 Tax=Spironucleus salmonicida TaxID=348837 RepID=V6LJW0_9EUKA|nr:hypothetical protein SS50377_24282 [Spironucleus salmonicida]|eukprot:EST44822.1 Hypothetical protein SS50377_15268 [Spironucleus salmonicida]
MVLFNPSELVSNLPDIVYINTFNSIIIVAQLQELNPMTTFVFPVLLTHFYRQLYNIDFLMNISAIELENNQNIDNIKADNFNFIYDKIVIEDTFAPLNFTSEKYQVLKFKQPQQLMHLLAQLKKYRIIFEDSEIMREISQAFPEYLDVTDTAKFCDSQEAKSQQQFYDFTIKVQTYISPFKISEAKIELSEFMLRGISEATKIRDEFWQYPQYKKRPDWMRGMVLTGEVTVMKIE